MSTQSARRQSSISGTASLAVPSSVDHQISYKKPVKVRNELNEKRRNALKEYYKLKQQQQNLQKEADTLQKHNENLAVIDTETDLETEILQNRPIKEIDLINSSFKEIVSSTNRSTSSINLINSSIKNIIYNNYYELIKLNQFLGNLNDLDLSKINENDDDNNNEPKAVDLLSKLNLNTNRSKETKDETHNESEDLGFSKLNELMEKIERFDKNDYRSNKPTNQNHENIKLITNLLELEELKDDKQKKTLNNQLTKIITGLKSSNGSELLIEQFQDLQKLTSST